jgi:lysophospholipase
MIDVTGVRLSHVARRAIKLMRWVGLGGSYVPGGDGTVEQARPFLGNRLTSDPVRYARNSAVLEAEPALGLGAPTIGWASAAFSAMREFAKPEYPAHIRHPMLMIAAGSDAIVSTTATEEFAIRLRAGSHLVLSGAKHELLMEQDRLRGQFWAAFDAFVPGTPLY